MKKTIVILALSVLVTSAVSHAVIFSDDFENGTLDKWTIVGLEIVGPAGAAENSNTTYKAIAYYDIGNPKTSQLRRIGLLIRTPIAVLQRGC